MTIHEMKQLEGSGAQHTRLKQLLEAKKITWKQYEEIKTAWRIKQRDYKEALKGDLVDDAKAVFGDRILGEVDEE